MTLNLFTYRNFSSAFHFVGVRVELLSRLFLLPRFLLPDEDDIVGRADDIRGRASDTEVRGRIALVLLADASSFLSAAFASRRSIC